MAPVGRARVLQLPRGTGKPGSTGGFSGEGDSILATDIAPSRAAAPGELGPLPPIGRTMVTPTAGAPSLSRAALCRHTSKIRASCGNAARGDPCGGQRATAVPTATQQRKQLHRSTV